MFLLPIMLALGTAFKLKTSQAAAPPTPTPPAVPTPTKPQVLESEAAIRKRLSQTGRGTTIFTGGLFDNPTSRKERLIPV